MVWAMSANSAGGTKLLRCMYPQKTFWSWYMEMVQNIFGNTKKVIPEFRDFLGSQLLMTQDWQIMIFYYFWSMISPKWYTFPKMFFFPEFSSILIDLVSMYSFLIFVFVQTFFSPPFCHFFIKYWPQEKSKLKRK